MTDPEIDEVEHDELDEPPSGPSRRAVLAVIGGGALLVGGGGLAIALSRNTGGSGTTEPGAKVSDGSGVSRIGRRYLDDHPGEDLASLTRDLPALAADPRPEQIALLADRIAEDFGAGQVVELDGWVLSRTEAKASALIALAHP